MSITPKEFIFNGFLNFEWVKLIGSTSGRDQYLTKIFKGIKDDLFGVIESNGEFLGLDGVGGSILVKYTSEGD